MYDDIMYLIVLMLFEREIILLLILGIVQQNKWQY